MIGWAVGLALLGTLVFSLVGLFLDRDNIDFHLTMEPTYPYDVLYVNERLRNSRIKFDFLGRGSKEGLSQTRDETPP